MKVDCYISSCDPAIRPMVKADMDKIEHYIQKEWPVLYSELVESGKFSGGK